MSFFDALRHRAYVLVRGEKYAVEIEREMRFHLDLEAAAAEHSGVPPRDSELAARKQFGNLTYHREEARRMTALSWLDHLRQDLSYGVRGLRRSPGFTVTVALTLGLGLGVNASMFSLLDRLFIRAPSGVIAPREVRRLYQELARPKEPAGRLTFEVIRYAQYRAIAAADSTLQLAAFTQPESTAIVQGDTRRAIRESLVTGGYFKLLGIRPQLGRFFVDEETRIATPTPVVVLSDALWRRDYNADPGILGNTISINLRPFTVVGVAPSRFSGLDIDAVDVWLPANTYEASATPDGSPWYETFLNSFIVVARVPNAAAEERFLAVATNAFRSVHLKFYEFDSTARVRAGPILQAAGPGRSEKEVSISTRLAGVALIVLLIACANVGNLLLVRATHRRREIAVRRALGVSRGRLYEQLLVESVLLAMLGGAVAVAFAYWAGTALRRLLLPNIQWADGAVDLRVVAFVAVASLLVGVIAGLAPAFQSNQADVTSALKAGSRETAYPRSTLREALLVAQAALSVVLLVGAGLFVRSLSIVQALDLGYDTDHTLFVSPRFSPSPAPAKDVLAAAIAQVAQRLAAAPAVEAVGYASSAPMAGISFESLFLPGRDSLPKLGDSGPGYTAISPGYMRAAGVKLVAGREFNERDQAAAQKVIIVSQSMARVMWPGENALGKCLIEGARTNPCSVVVGVTADVHQMSVIERPTMQFFIPAAQAGTARVAQNIVIRTTTPYLAAVERLAALELKHALPTMTTPRIIPMKESLERQFRPWRLGATLFTTFGILALLVAAIGIYSVVAYGVSQRTHELGIRIALGGQLADLLTLVLSEALKVVAMGIGLGVVASLMLGKLVASLLYGLSPRDPVVIVGAAMVLCAIGIGSSLIPAWRAARVDPVRALRAD